MVEENISPILVVFDLDGTLVDTLPAIVPAVNQLRARFHLAPLKPEAIQAAMGVPLDIFIERVINMQRGSMPYRSRKERFCQSAIELYRPYYRHSLESHARMYDGVEEVLSQLSSRGTRLAILTNKSHGLAVETVEAMGLSRFFPAGLVIGSDSLSVSKPDPQTLETIMDILGIVPSDDVWMVGDSDVDLMVAEAAGVTGIACSYGYGNAGSSIDAQATIDSPEHLLALLTGPLDGTAIE